MEAFYEFVSELNTFDEFVEKLSEEESTTVKGRHFEYFSKHFFNTNPQCIAEFKEYYMLADLPETIRKKLKIPNNDIGVDAVAINKDDECIAIQVKYRSDYNKSICYRELSTFLSTTYAYGYNFKGAIFFSNTKYVNKTVENCDKVRCFLYDNVNNISETFFKNIRAPDKQEQIVINQRDYQTDIIKSAKKYFKKVENKRGIIYMPCGTGKTVVSYWITEALKADKVIIAVPSLYLLSQIYYMYVQMNTNIKYLLIGSDFDNENGNKERIVDIKYTTNDDTVEEFLDKNEKFIIITTYQSSNILHKISKKLNIKYDITIFDEAHKTCGDYSRKYCKLLHETIKIKKRLFMTATEKVYKKNEDHDEISSMDDDNIYGKVIYRYSLGEAIESEHLTDYKIIAPFINEKFSEIIINNNYINVKDKIVTSRLLMTALLIIKSFNDHEKISHMLTFSNFNNDVITLSNLLNNFTKNIKIFILSGNDSMKKRRSVINEFCKSKKAIICSAKIFAEGVNIPIVNSICFIDNKASIIDIIQCCGRPLRLYPTKKMAYILLPTVIEDVNDNVLNISEDFGNIKAVLKALGSIDKRLVEEFKVKDRKNFGGTSNKFTIECNNVLKFGKNIDFKELYKSLSISVYNKYGKNGWTLKFERLKEFIEDNDDKYPSDHSKDEDEQILGAWLNRQKLVKRGVYKAGILTDKCVKLLETLPFWKWDTKIQWIDIYNELKEFLDKHDRYPKRSIKEETSLYRWIEKQRMVKRGTIKDGILTKERIKSLEELYKWKWNPKN